MSRYVVTIVQSPSEIVVVSTSGAAGTSGLDSVSEDLSPELGGDLTLGSYNIVGTLENNTLILDGGLL